MADPKKALEAQIYALLATGSWPVFNTKAVATSFAYVVFQAIGGDDDGYHLKNRTWVYAYQVKGIHLDRALALDMFTEFDALMATGLTVAGFGTVQVVRTSPVDYTEVTTDGEYIYHVGGVYEIELEVN